MSDKTAQPDINHSAGQSFPVRDAIAVDLQLMQAIGNYLGHQPYNQVADMIRGLEKSPRVSIREEESKGQ